MHRSLGIRTFLLKKKKGLKLVVLNWLHQFISSPLNNILHEHRISICKKHFTPSLTLTIIKTNMSSEPQAVPFSYLHFTVWSGSVLCLRCSCRTFSPSTRWEALKPRSTRTISLATYHSACIWVNTAVSLALLGMHVLFYVLKATEVLIPYPRHTFIPEKKKPFSAWLELTRYFSMYDTKVTVKMTSLKQFTCEASLLRQFN